jgi:hypothetical protein
MFRDVLSLQGLKCALSGLSLLAFAALAFLFGCFELLDTDIWWHLRAGEWILHNGRVPDLDPFSFGSADQRWIDLHWLFQIIMAVCYRAAGVAGLLLLTSAVASTTFVTAAGARPAGAPWPVVLLAMLPGLLLASNRFDPRPEMFTLLFLAAFLTVLAHVERRPRVAWLLPVIQFFWVNMHGLFIFGPIVLAVWWLSWLGLRGWRRWRGETAAQPAGTRQLAAASLAVLVCCLANPYGLEGVLLPWQLYPKVTQEGNPYKDYIEEFMSSRRYAAYALSQGAAGRWILGVFHFLLLLVPLSFLMPSAWEASQPRAKNTPLPREGRSVLVWLGALALLVVLLLVRVFGLTRANRSGVLADATLVVPYALLTVGAVAAVLLRHRRSAVLLCLSGGIGLAAWSGWLAGYLSVETPSPSLLAIAALAGCLAMALVLSHGGRLFHMLLAVALAYLALKAVNSFARFGLVAGMVLAANLGAWAGRLAPLARPAWSWSARLALPVLLIGGVATVAGELYTHWTGETRRLALRERPLYFAHEAAQFAGQPGLPRRALVYEIGQSGVYVFHNAPENKVFMDARLETPTLETFRRYVEIERHLHEPNSRWTEDLHALGDPLLLLAHDGNAQAEAALLSQSGWRCVYLDALAAVFVRRGDADLEIRFPDIDPVARHFGAGRLPSRPESLGAAWREAKALYNLGQLMREESSAWQGRIPWLLAALDRCEYALAEQPADAGPWTVLGNCHWTLIPNLRQAPPSLGQPWLPSSGLAWAHSTYCFRQALERAPQDERILQALFRSFGIRRMVDAQRKIGARLLATGKLPVKQADTVRKSLEQLPSTPAFSIRQGLDVSAPILLLLQQGWPIEATRLADQRTPETGWAWPVADPLAAAWMHLGYPDKARAVWQNALHPPSEAVRQERLGSTYWVERDFEEATSLYRQSWSADPSRFEPGWALAWLHTQRGEAEPALRACRATLTLKLPEPLAEELRHLEKLLLRAADGRQATSAETR